MSDKYKVQNNDELYFVTLTVVGWVDFFIRDEYRKIILDSLTYCSKTKGLEVYAWVIMTSHVHLIIGKNGPNDISSIVRDFKKFTSKKLIEEIGSTHESRKVWMLKKFSFEAARSKRGKDYALWQEGYHPIELSTGTIMKQKLDYIHNNPVEAGFVEEAAHYIYSSARDYSGYKGMLAINYLY